MSDKVNEYGLGAPNTQDGPPQAREAGADPLAHGLGQRDVANEDNELEDNREGGKQNKLEHGLAGAGSHDQNLAPHSGKPDPLSHGLGSPDTNREQADTP